MSTKSVSICVFALFLAASSFAASFIPPSDRGMVHRSDAVIVGSALHSYSQFNADGAIETVTTISVQEVIKGSILAQTIDVHEPGGVVDGRIRVLPGVPRFADGEQVILFLRHPFGTWVVADIDLGKFTFETDNAGQRLAIRSEADVPEWNPAESAPLRRSADLFLRYLRAVARGGSPAVDYIVPYHPLRVRSDSFRIAPNATFVPTATSFTSDFSSGSGVRWCQNNCGGATTFVTPVPFYTEPGASAPETTAASTAMAAWNSDNRSGVNYGYGVDPSPPHTNGALGPPDGANTVLFEQNLTSIGINALTCPGDGSYSGVLGIGGTTAGGPGTHTGPDGATFFNNVEVDVSMNQGVTTCVAFMGSGGGGDFASAVTHEVGHTLGFRHADQTRANNPAILCNTDSTLECSNSAIMKSFVSTGLNATLQTYDQDAVRGVYPWSRYNMSGDGLTDLVWRAGSIGADSMWFMNGPTVAFSIAEPMVLDPNFKVVGIGDFDGDGKADVLWRNSSTGANVIWFMNGGSIASSALLPTVADTTWVVAGVGDFDGDGKADILWHNTAVGANSVWLMNGSTISSSGTLPTVSDPTWNIVGIGDFDGDGKDDVLWRNSSIGANVIWLMNGLSVGSSALLPTVPDTNWQVVGVGDFDGDGKADILWRHAGVGADAVWFMNGGTVASSAALPTVSNLGFKVVRVGDFQGDGKADIMWRNTATGDNALWLMNGSTVAASFSLPFVNTAFSVVP